MPLIRIFMTGKYNQSNFATFGLVKLHLKILSYALIRWFTKLISLTKYLFIFFLFQYFFNLPDSSVERFLKLFTFLPCEEISSVVETHLVSEGGGLTLGLC